MTVQHTVTLLHASPLHLASHGARTCWDSHDKSDTCLHTDTRLEMPNNGHGYCVCNLCEEEVQSDLDIICGPNDAALIDRVGNKFRHASILEHLNYTFYIEGISRACLQELSRHRHTSPSVKSTRYTLKELKDHVHDETKDSFITWASKFCVMTKDPRVNTVIAHQLLNLRGLIVSGCSNDEAKYALPEAYKVSEQLTINARSLQNFLSLRSDKSALWEIRQLATSLYETLPAEHQYLFIHCMKEV